MIYDWLFFDADGTLFDYDLAEAKALEGTFRELGIPFNPGTAEAYRAINHQIWLDFENGRVTAEALRTRRFELLFTEVGVNADPLGFSTRYLVHLSEASDLIPGAEAVVRSLHEQYRLAIITNGLQDVQRPRLERSGIGDLFEVVAISEEIGVAKPDARFFEAALARAGSPPRQRVLVIGDSLSSDIQGGINAGLDTCWFNPGGKPPNPSVPARCEIRTLEELIPLLSGAG